MIFSNGETEDEIKGIYSVAYPSELANGVLIDMENHYTFLSDHVPEQLEAGQELCEDDEFEHFDLSECEIDWDIAPHSWILKALGNIIVDDAERMTREACEPNTNDSSSP